MHQWQRSPNHTVPAWGLGDAIAGWLIAYTAASLFGGVLLLATGHADTPASELPMTLVALGYPPLWLGFVLVPHFATKLKGSGWVEDLRLRFRPIDLVGLPIGALAQVILVPLVSFPILELTGKDSEDLGRSARELADQASGSGLGVALLFLTVVIGAPIAEEIFFRGLVMRGFEKRFGIAIAVVASSLLFAATHFQALQFAALAAAGLVFALLAVKTDRLGMAMTAHMGFNAVTVVNLVWLA